MQVPLSDQVDVAGFHSAATRLLANQVPPETVEWSAAPAQSIDTHLLEGERAQIRSRAARAIIPQSFVRMSELVLLHRDADRFDLLYRALWRLVHEPDLKHDSGDTDLARLRQMAQAVRRDIQKMKVRTVFQPMELHGRTIDVAWYAPTHFVCELVGAWFATRRPEHHWLLLTPERSLRWNGDSLLAAPALPPGQQLPDLGPGEWAKVLEAQPWTAGAAAPLTPGSTDGSGRMKS